MSSASYLGLFLASAGLVLAGPPMGWNSYNSFGCNPSEDRIKESAQGLIDLGLRDVGYDGVTVDCGWPSNKRDAEGKLVWNPELFPSGGKALGDFIHGLGLRYGLYSGAGYLQCGSEDIPASLGYEAIDAASFAEWGGDSLKYDNCYSTSNTTMVDADSEEAQSPQRFIKMAEELKKTGREIDYYLCQWGIGENVPHWATEIGRSWRMSNDIYNAWRNIWRITNHVLPHARYTKPGAYADMDMLIVGLEVLTPAEERFHFGMWAIMKSPLIIGCPISDETPKDSLEILENEEVIAINQDSLGEAATLALRNTEGEWDIWIGNLSEERKVVGISNWKDQPQSVTFDLHILGIGSASARDVWAGEDIGSVSGEYTVDLTAHEMQILVLTDIEATDGPQSEGYYGAQDAKLAGGAALISCSDTDCLPSNSKVGNIDDGSSVTLEGVSSSTAGKKLVGIDFINYEYSFHDAWDFGTNTRNVTIQVNDEAAKKWTFPLGGNDWFESGRLTIELDGFTEGDGNVIVFAGTEGHWAPDFVGLELFA